MAKDTVNQLEAEWAATNMAMTGAERQRRYKQTPKGRATDRRFRQSTKGRLAKARDNERRFFVGGMYLGMAGFTQTELKGLLNGTSD